MFINLQPLFHIGYITHKIGEITPRLQLLQEKKLGGHFCREKKGRKNGIEGVEAKIMIIR